MKLRAGLRWRRKTCLDMRLNWIAEWRLSIFKLVGGTYRASVNASRREDMSAERHTPVQSQMVEVSYVLDDHMHSEVLHGGREGS